MSICQVPDLDHKRGVVSFVVVWDWCWYDYCSDVVVDYLISIEMQWLLPRIGEGWSMDRGNLLGSMMTRMILYCCCECDAMMMRIDGGCCCCCCNHYCLLPLIHHHYLTLHSRIYYDCYCRCYCYSCYEQHLAHLEMESLAQEEDVAAFAVFAFVDVVKKSWSWVRSRLHMSILCSREERAYLCSLSAAWWMMMVVFLLSSSG